MISRDFSITEPSIQPPDTEPKISEFSETNILLPTGLGELPHVLITVAIANLIFFLVQVFAFLSNPKSFIAQI